MPGVRVLCVLLPLLLPVAAMAVEAVVLEYHEWEPDRPAYANRVTITPGFLRQDIRSGSEPDSETGPQPTSKDFLLFDRAAATVYSVDADAHTILVMKGGRAVGESPIALQLSEHSVSPADAPTVAGRPVLVTEYRVNGELCYRSSSVPGLSPEAVAAWQEFNTVMAAQRAVTLGHTPAEQLDPCLLATAIFAPVRHLQQGLPIREDNPIGISRELLDFRPVVEVDAALFRLPEGYRSITIGGGGQ
jgi:hypothetical protein